MKFFHLTLTQEYGYFFFFPSPVTSLYFFFSLSRFLFPSTVPFTIITIFTCSIINLHHLHQHDPHHLSSSHLLGATFSPCPSHYRQPIFFSCSQLAALLPYSASSSFSLRLTTSSSSSLAANHRLLFWTVTISPIVFFIIGFVLLIPVFVAVVHVFRGCCSRARASCSSPQQRLRRVPGLHRRDFSRG